MLPARRRTLLLRRRKSPPMPGDLIRPSSLACCCTRHLAPVSRSGGANISELGHAAYFSRLQAALYGHTDQVLSAAFSPDGTRIVTTSTGLGDSMADWGYGSGLGEQARSEPTVEAAGRGRLRREAGRHRTCHARSDTQGDRSRSIRRLTYSDTNTASILRRPRRRRRLRMAAVSHRLASHLGVSWPMTPSAIAATSLSALSKSTSSACARQFRLDLQHYLCGIQDFCITMSLTEDGRIATHRGHKFGAKCLTVRSLTPMRCCYGIAHSVTSPASVPDEKSRG